jgi:hypothetical protein
MKNIAVHRRRYKRKHGDHRQEKINCAEDDDRQLLFIDDEVS